MTNGEKYAGENIIIMFLSVCVQSVMIFGVDVNPQILESV